MLRNSFCREGDAALGSAFNFFTSIHKKCIARVPDSRKRKSENRLRLVSSPHYPHIALVARNKRISHFHFHMTNEKEKNNVGEKKKVNRNFLLGCLGICGAKKEGGGGREKIDVTTPA